MASDSALTLVCGNWVTYVVHAQVGQVLVVQAQQGLAVDVVLDHQVRVLALVQVVEPSAVLNRLAGAHCVNSLLLNRTWRTRAGSTVVRWCPVVLWPWVWCVQFCSCTPVFSHPK